MTNPDRFNVLIADDEPRFCEILEDLLASQDINLYCVNTPENAIKAVLNHDIHLALLDKRFPTDHDGIQTLRRVKEIKPETEVIMMTAYPDQESNLDAIAMGAHSYLPKTMDYEKMQTVLTRLFGLIRMKRQNVSLIAELEERNQWLESIASTIKNWNEKLVRRLKIAESGQFSPDRENETVENFLPPDNVELFAVALVHELNNHLQVIDFILSEFTGGSREKMEESAGELQEAISQLSSIAQNYAQIISGQDNNAKKEIDFEQLLQYVFKAAWRLAQGRGISITRQVALTGQKIKGQARLLSDALLNILKNAIEAAEPHGSEKKAAVFLQVYQNEAEVVVEIGNSGAPIDENIFNSLFIGMSQKAGHMGVGLCLARHAIEKHDGKIEVIRRDDWNVFKISLPQ